MSVEKLRNRLRQGKIYDPEKIEQALTNFFRKGNLTALRELALRAVADEVGEKAASYRAREGLEPPGHSREGDGRHELARQRRACSASARASPAGSGRDWYAVYVETPREEPGRIEPRTTWRCSDNIRLAEQLGAKVVQAEGLDGRPTRWSSSRSAKASRTSSSASRRDRAGIC